MQTIKTEVYDLEIENTKLNIEKEYEKAAKSDPNVIRLIDAAQDRLAEITKTNKSGKVFVPFEEVGNIIIDAILSYRHLIIRNYQINKLERGYNRECKIDLVKGGTSLDKKETQGRGKTEKKGNWVASLWKKFK